MTMLETTHLTKLATAFAVGALLGACQGHSPSTGLLDRGTCDVLIDCAASLSPEARDEYEQVYGPGGTCWGDPGNWATCRDFCSSTLNALNLVAMVSGEACGNCMYDVDCSSYGIGSTCVAGLCTGGFGGNAEGETGDPTGDGDGDTAGDGDGDTTGDGDEDGCSEVPTVCQDLITCLAIAAPQVDTSEIDEGGSCWCGTSQQAQDCTSTCIEQAETAAETYPNIPACAGDFDPCPVGTEGCECGPGDVCEGQLLCNTGLVYRCDPPVFVGECPVDPPFQDAFCPDAGCPNGYLYLDTDFDGVADFSTCRWPCDEESGLGECNDIPGADFLDGDLYCKHTFPFGFESILACVNYCDDGCPDAAICINDVCWYDLP